MTRTGRRILSTVPAAAVALVCALTFLVQDACILAQPSGEVPRPAQQRPTILHASVVPSTSAVLTRWPADSIFLVPVELADPTVSIEYAAFVDFNAKTGEGLVGEPQSIAFETANTTGNTRTLSVNIPEPDLAQCHRVEIVVALRLSSRSDGKNAHTPAEPGGDIATWFYNPNGDLGGCPTLDAGIDAPADAEAGEGAAQ